MRQPSRFVALILLSYLAAAVSVAGQQAAPDEATLRRAKQLEQQLAAQFRDKEYDKAAATCRELIQLLPKNAAGHYNLACALARLNQTDAALDSLAKAVELGYADAAHMQKDDDLAKLRDDKRFADLLVKVRVNRQQAVARLPYDKGAEIKEVKTVEGNPDDGLRWRLRIAETATPEKPHRLLVWLHPSGGSMNNIVEALSPRLAARGWALLVLTQKSFAGWSEDDAQRLGITLADVARQKEIDVRRPVLLGYSAGGQMALELWYADPTKWGGLVLDAAYPVRPENGKHVPRPVPKNDAIKKVPLFVLVGAMDGGSPLWKQLTPAWREAAVPLTIRHIEGKGHTWLFGKSEIELMEQWLTDVAAGKLPSDPADNK